MNLNFLSLIILLFFFLCGVIKGSCLDFNKKNLNVLEIKSNANLYETISISSHWEDDFEDSTKKLNDINNIYE